MTHGTGAMDVFKYTELSLLDLVRLAWLSCLSLELRVVARQGRGKMVLRDGEVIYATVGRRGSHGRQAFVDMAFWEDIEEIGVLDSTGRHAANIEIPTRMLLQLCKESARIQAVIRKLNTQKHRAVQRRAAGDGPGSTRRRPVHSSSSILPVVPPTEALGGEVALAGGTGRVVDPRAVTLFDPLAASRADTLVVDPDELDAEGEPLGRVETEENVPTDALLAEQQRAARDPIPDLAAAMKDQIPGAKLAAILDVGAGEVLGLASDLAGADRAAVTRAGRKVWDMLAAALTALPAPITGDLKAVVMSTDTMSVHATVDVERRTAVVVACDVHAGNLGLLRMLSRKYLARVLSARS